MQTGVAERETQIKLKAARSEIDQAESPTTRRSWLSSCDRGRPRGCLLSVVVAGLSAFQPERTATRDRDSGINQPWRPRNALTGKYAVPSTFDSPSTATVTVNHPILGPDQLRPD